MPAIVPTRLLMQRPWASARGRKLMYPEPHEDTSAALRAVRGLTMDAGRFDHWTRRLAASSRRSVLRRAAGTVLAAALGHRLASPAAARCVGRGEACNPASCCGFLNLTCRQGTCKCRSGFADCDRDGNCETNRLTDPDNCGTCGSRCPSGVCSNGACTCNRNDHCPQECRCTSRVGGGGVCARATRCGSIPTCESDVDCPPRELCAFCGGNKQCRGECAG